jgi:Domain of unknown function (DUF4917)
MAEPDDSLKSWDDVKDSAKWKGLLVGNGASIAIYSGFEYKSLFVVATEELDVPDRLSALDQRLFPTLHAGSNFEQVLYGLATARRVAQVLNPSMLAQIDQTYQNVRESQRGSSRPARRGSRSVLPSV